MNFFNTKHINKILFAGFFITVALSCLGFTASSENLSTNLIRLHVKANSNSEQDQAIKLIVKDEISDYTADILQSTQNVEQAYTILLENLNEIEQQANQKLEDLNSAYTATVELTTEYFPTREYETFTLPAGDYSSLKISIGEAVGDNWWCVVYPSLCTSTAIEGELSEQDEELITQTPKITFKIYEIYLDMVKYFKGVDINKNDK